MTTPTFNLSKEQLEAYRPAAESFKQAENAETDKERATKLEETLANLEKEREPVPLYPDMSSTEKKPIIVNAKLAKGNKNLMRIETVEHEPTPEFVKLADGSIVPILMTRKERRELYNEVKTAVRKGRPIKVKCKKAKKNKRR